MNENSSNGSNNDNESEKTVLPIDTFQGKIQSAENTPPSLIILIGPPDPKAVALS